MADMYAFLHLHQILPSIANAHPAVRNMAVVCLGTCILHSKELAKTHMVLLLQVNVLLKTQIHTVLLQYKEVY